MFSRFCSLPQVACGLILLISVGFAACGTTFQSPATSGKSSGPILVVAADTHPAESKGGPAF